MSDDLDGQNTFSHHLRASSPLFSALLRVIAIKESPEDMMDAWVQIQNFRSVGPEVQHRDHRW